jgi:hypothetical protein
MSEKHLPSNPNLDQLKHQAKDLLKAHAAGDPDAIRRVREFHPRYDETTMTVSDAQLVVAREYGFASWPRLKAHVDSLRADRSQRFAGEWIAEISTLRLSVEGNAVTITDAVLDASNTIRADGYEYPTDHGFALTARWIGLDTLEAVVKAAGQTVARVTYEISGDGGSLTVSAISDAHNGYPASERTTVFHRHARE